MPPPSDSSTPAPWRVDLAELRRLALPAIATQIGGMLLGVVDVMMLGHYSADSVGAVALANVWIMGTMIVGFGIVLGLDPIISQAHGAGDGERLGRALQRGLVVALLASLPLALLWLFTEPVLLFFGQAPGLAHEAGLYVLVNVPGLPPFLLFAALRQYLQGRGITQPAMWIMFAANAVNVLGNWLLIYGKAGAPELGAVGAGWSTSLTRILSLLALVVWVRWRGLYRGAWVPWSKACLERRGLLEILRYGLPTGIQFGLELWAFEAATLLAGRLSHLALASHSMVLTLASLSFMLPLGISIGVSTLVGNRIGADQYHAAQRAAWLGLACGAGVMLLSAVTFVLLRNWLPTLFSDDPAVIALCAAVLPIAAAFQVFDGTQAVGSGVLRGMGHTRPAAVINFVGYFVVGLPLAGWLAFGCGWELAGIWTGLAIGLAIVALALVAWIARRGPSSMHAAPAAHEARAQ